MEKVNFIGKFKQPFLLDDGVEVGEVMDNLYRQNTVPISVTDDHPIKDNMKRMFPQINFTWLIFTITYDKPFEA